MKKAIIFSVLILCSVSVFAQNKMSKADFEHLVDYANCQYLMAFIEKNDAGKPYIKDNYEKSVKPELQKATLDDLTQVPTIDKIKGLFSNSSNNLALKLAEKINERKNKYNTLPDNNSLVKELSTTGWKNVDLTSVATKIQNSIRTKYNAEPKQAPKPVSEQEVVRNQTIQTSSQVDELQAKIDNLQQQYENLKDDSKLANLQERISTLRLLVFICLGLIAILIVVLFLWYKSQFNAENDNSKLKKFIKNIVLHSNDISNKFANNNSNVSMFEDKLQKQEWQIGELLEKVKKIEIQNNSNQQTQQQGNDNPKSDPDPKLITPKDDSQYFSSKNKKTMINETSKDNAKFRVFNVKGNEADFEYCGGVTNLDFFENVCDFEPKAYQIQNKTSIKPKKNGKVIKNSDGNWEVSIPAFIEIS